MNKGIRVLLLGLVFAGCGKKMDSGDAGATSAAVSGSALPDGAAARLVHDYWNQEKCGDRVKFILAPEANREALVDAYKDMKSCVTKLDSIDDADCTSAAAGAYCSLHAKSGNETYDYCLKNDNGAFKIDWRCSKGFNPMPMVVFKSQRPKTPSVFRVKAKISDYYNYEYSAAQKSHYSIALVAGDARDQVNGYIKKESPDGQAVFDILKDGRSHQLMLELVYAKNSGDSGITTITRVVAKDWHQQAEEK